MMKSLRRLPRGPSRSVGMAAAVGFFCLLVAGGFAAGSFLGRVVCIDAGHQAQSNNSQEPIGPGATETKPCVSSGTSGSVAGPESAVNLDVALRLHDILTSNGVLVVMVRTTQAVDLCNSERADIGNRSHADLMIRLHCNSGSVHGCLMLYPAKITGWTDDIYDASLKAAQIVQTAYSKYTGLPNLALTPRSDLSGFNYANVPSILPEMIHMQNTSDDQLVATPGFRQRMAEGLALGILDYLSTLPPAAPRSIGFF